LNYCTLFNINYLSRGLALYQSLVAHAKDFHLTIFAFDNDTYQILSAMKLPQVRVVALADFETPALLAVKPSRRVGEYCWTCTPSIILHCLEHYGLSQVCYIDADLFFWEDPALLLEEVGSDDAVLITEHRYTPKYDNAAYSGKYCVQFMLFKNNVEGLAALLWWRDACLDWCFNRVEDEKFGDQKYLDDWTTRFKGVKVLQHLGGGVAPWNVQQYTVKSIDGKVMIEKPGSGISVPLVFYHFHALKFINNAVELGGYKLSRQVIACLYTPYIKALLAQSFFVKTTRNIHGHTQKKHGLKEMLKTCKNHFLGINKRISLGLHY